MILIQNLAIEVTRKCNLKCDHCLRGDSQKLNIPLVYIDILLNQVYSIGHFCPTGGEPSLNVPAIKYFIDGCKKRHIPIETFYIATNGVKITEEFIEICKELYDMCKNKPNSSVQIELFDKNTLYLNVNGDIINGCDWSYENQDLHFLCKVDSIESFKKLL